MALGFISLKNTLCFLFLAKSENTLCFFLKSTFSEFHETGIFRKIPGSIRKKKHWCKQPAMIFQNVIFLKKLVPTPVIGQTWNLKLVQDLELPSYTLAFDMYQVGVNVVQDVQGICGVPQLDNSRRRLSMNSKQKKLSENFSKMFFFSHSFSR